MDSDSDSDFDFDSDDGMVWIKSQTINNTESNIQNFLYIYLRVLLLRVLLLRVLLLRVLLLRVVLPPHLGLKSSAISRLNF